MLVVLLMAGISAFAAYIARNADATSARATEDRAQSADHPARDSTASEQPTAPPPRFPGLEHEPVADAEPAAPRAERPHPVVRVAAVRVAPPPAPVAPIVPPPGGGEPARATDQPLPGKGAKLDAHALARVIDSTIQKKLDEAKVAPAPLADDAEFLRRIYLDLHGTIPTLNQAVAFLDSKDPDKRTKLIDELLANPAYGENLADTWMDRMNGNPGSRKAYKRGPLRQWLAQSFNANRPWNEQVHDMLASAGPTSDVGGAGVPAAWMSPPDRELIERVNLVARVFLGRGEIKCAECHSHPYTSFRRKDYWGFAMLFAQAGNRYPNTLVDNLRPLTAKDVDEGMLVPPAFLDGSPASTTPQVPFRQTLARWVTAAQNPYFARAKANWVWAGFFGRGFTEEYDEMGEAPVSHPELLQTLADQFVANGFDVRYLIRAIVSSQAYQRSSKVAGASPPPRELFSRQTIRMLKPRQLLYSWGTLGERTGLANAGDKGRLTILRLVGSFAAVDSVDGELPDYTLYERNLSDQAKFIDSMTVVWAEELVKRLVRASETPEQNLQRFYLAILTRPPLARETTAMAAHVRKVGVREGYVDVAWVLLNSTEFASNH